MVSVISPGVTTRAPSGCGDAPLARGAEALAKREGLVEPDGRGLAGTGWTGTGWTGLGWTGAGWTGAGYGHGLDGRDWGRAGGRAELGRANWAGAAGLRSS